MIWKSTLLLIATSLASAAEDEHLDEEAPEPANAVLFPAWSLTLGVVAFYVLSRYARALPYTAVMFLLGTLMGITVELGDFHDHIGDSIRLWTGINSEVLLLVFLPGLLFRDAMSQNVHLFVYAINQIMIFAFPMVLAGTVLTALVAFYIFPYDWPFNLAMAFGSILSATDPVAVAALLEEVGAPPRLKVHIAGESLVNDGAAIVFFSIFYQKYLFEDLADIGGQEHGENIDVAKGFAMFFQKAVGGFAVGLMFGIVQLIILFLLDRRVSREENIVQVTSVIGMAYLNFYTADFVWQTSGVISTVTAGLIVKLFGRAGINDLKLLEDSMALLEHLLNTVLFTLGGIVWGTVVVTGEKLGTWGGKDWGYLILLYILLHVIRALLFGLAYPVTVRIGLQTDVKETVFQVYGGLRGALGIALAIALDNEVSVLAGGRWETAAERHTTQAFVMVGGIAFMTLVINGITAGPLLRKLGLADSSDARGKIIKSIRVRLRAAAIDDFVHLLTQPRFHHTNFALVKHHVPFLVDMTKAQFLEAVHKNKEQHASDYAPPFLGNVLPYLPICDNEDSTVDMEQCCDEEILAEFENYNRKAKMERRTKSRKNKRRRRHSSNIRAMLQEEPLSARELRLLFVSILKAQYDKQMERGELEYEHLLALALSQSLDFAVSSIQKGKPLQDWKYLTRLHDPLVKFEKKLKANRAMVSCLDKTWSHRANLGIKLRADASLIERAMTFMSAHEASMKMFRLEFEDLDSELGDAEKHVLQESLQQYALAQASLKEYDPKVVESTSSHKLCKILLNMTIHHVEKLVKSGLLKEAEAEPFLEEYQETLDHVLSCEEFEHPGEILDLYVQQEIANPLLESAQFDVVNPSLESAQFDGRGKVAVVKEGSREEDEEEEDRSRHLNY